MSAVIEHPTVATEQLLVLRPDQVEPWPGLNPRRRPRDPQKFADLVASVRDGGVHMPVVVHDRAAAGEWSGPEDGVPYWLVAGEGRWLATQEVPGALLPARPRVFTFERALRVALIENLQREDLSPLDEAYAYRRLLDEGGMTQAQLAETVGVKQPTIANRLRLLELPQVTLDLIDEGIVQQSHARDYLLPFMGIPEAKRKKLFEGVAKKVAKLGKDAGGDALAGEVVRDVIGEIASGLSRPISGGWGPDAPLFKPSEHKTCGCNGPRFRYDRWRGPTVRCFDDGWWKRAQEKARKEQEEADRRAQQRIANAEAADGVVPVVSRETFRKLYDYRQYKHLSSYAAPLMDPAELAGAKFVAVRSEIGNDPEIYCVDMAAVRRAKSAATKERNRLIQDRKAERGTRYLEEAARTELAPWMLAAILTHRPAREQIMNVGREIGLDMGKHGEVDQAVERLAADHVETLFKVLALRIRDGELGWQDKIEEEADKLLRKRFAPRQAALRKKLLAQIGENVSDAEPAEMEDPDAVKAPGEAECVVCGCTDSWGCDGGCEWLVVDRAQGVGVCSECADDQDGARKLLTQWAEEQGVELEALSAA